MTNEHLFAIEKKSSFFFYSSNDSPFLLAPYVDNSLLSLLRCACVYARAVVRETLTASLMTELKERIKEYLYYVTYGHIISPFFYIV
jgi:hypothetical protein